MTYNREVEANEKQLLNDEDRKIANLASRGLTLAHDLFSGSEYFSKIVATPGWMMDVFDSSRGKASKWFEFKPGVYFGQHFSLKTIIEM